VLFSKYEEKKVTGLKKMEINRGGYLGGCMTKMRERENCRHIVSDFYKEIKLGCVAVNGIEV
jgi:hypothetical protein